MKWRMKWSGLWRERRYRALMTIMAANKPREEEGRASVPIPTARLPRH